MKEGKQSLSLGSCLILIHGFYTTDYSMNLVSALTLVYKYILSCFKTKIDSYLLMCCVLKLGSCCSEWTGATQHENLYKLDLLHKFHIDYIWKRGHCRILHTHYAESGVLRSMRIVCKPASIDIIPWCVCWVYIVTAPVGEIFFRAQGSHSIAPPPLMLPLAQVFVTPILHHWLFPHAA